MTILYNLLCLKENFSLESELLRIRATLPSVLQASLGLTQVGETELTLMKRRILGVGGVSVGRGMCSEGDWVVVFGWVATKFGAVAIVLC